MKKIKWFGFTPITRRKIFGYLVKFKNNSTYLYSGGKWQTVTKLFHAKEND